MGGGGGGGLERRGMEGGGVEKGWRGGRVSAIKDRGEKKARWLWECTPFQGPGCCGLWSVISRLE